jgi:hypothetical protein
VLRGQARFGRVRSSMAKGASASFLLTGSTVRLTTVQVMSALEDQFLGLWQAHYPQLTFEREFSDIKAWEADYQERYAKSKRSKRYRADFAHIESFTAVEIQGGVYSRGRHVTGSGYERDCRKYNLAYTSGWTIFLLTSQMAKEAYWHALIASHIVESLARRA